MLFPPILNKFLSSSFNELYLYMFKFDNYFTFIALLASYFILFSFNSFILTWLGIEINIIIFILIVIFSSDTYRQGYKYNEGLYYLAVQSLGSMIFVMGSLISNILSDLVISFFLFFSLSIKIGLFPFHNWFFKICSSITNFSFCLLLRYQKFPFFFILSWLDESLLFILLFSNIVFGSIMLFFSQDIVNLLISSSIYFNFWGYFIVTSNFYLGRLYFFIYYLFLINLNLSFRYFNQDFNSYSSFIWFIFILFSLGLPPVSIFFFKFYVLDFYLYSLNYLFFILFWAFTFFRVVSYFFFLFKMVLFFQKLIKNFFIIEYRYLTFLSVFCMRLVLIF